MLCLFFHFLKDRVQSRLATATTQSAKVTKSARANPTSSTVQSAIRLNNNQTPCSTIRPRVERFNSAHIHSASTAQTPSMRRLNATKTPLTSSRAVADRKPGVTNTQTPLYGRHLNASKPSSRTVECAKSSVRRSIRLLNNKIDNEFYTPSANSRRQLFAINGSKIPVYKGDAKQYPKSEGAHLTSRRREEPSKVNAANRLFKNENDTNDLDLQTEMKTTTKKFNKRRSTNRFSMSQIESSCLILTPKLMRQLMNSASKANDQQDEGHLQDVDEEEEEEPIKVHSIKPSSLIKYLFSDKKKPMKMDLNELAEEASKKLNLNESSQQQMINESQSKPNENVDSVRTSLSTNLSQTSEQMTETQQQAIKEEISSQSSMAKQEEQVPKNEDFVPIQEEQENKIESQAERMELESKQTQEQEEIIKSEEDSQTVVDQQVDMEKPQEETETCQQTTEIVNQNISTQTEPEPEATINQMMVEPIQENQLVQEVDTENVNPVAAKTRGRRGKKAATNTKKKLEEIKANEMNENSNSEICSESEQSKPQRVLTRAQRAKLNAQVNN